MRFVPAKLCVCLAVPRWQLDVCFCKPPTKLCMHGHVVFQQSCRVAHYFMGLSDGANYFAYPGRSDLHCMTVPVFHRAAGTIDSQVS